MYRRIRVCLNVSQCSHICIITIHIYIPLILYLPHKKAQYIALHHAKSPIDPYYSHTFNIHILLNRINTAAGSYAWMYINAHTSIRAYPLHLQLKARTSICVYVERLNGCACMAFVFKELA